MCCKGFWTRITVFCLAFGLGLFVSSAFVVNKKACKQAPAINSIPEQLPAELQKSENDSPAKAKNCVPVNTQPEYVPLTANEDKSKAVQPEIKEDKKAKNKESSLVISDKKLEEMSKDLQKRLKEESNPETLLYKERCFEAQEQK